MRVLGWSLFAATCVAFALQGVFLAASTYSMTSYEVLVDHVFPLLGIGAVVGAGVGALIVSRYPRNLVGWLFLIGRWATSSDLPPMPSAPSWSRGWSTHRGPGRSPAT